MRREPSALNDIRSYCYLHHLSHPLNALEDVMETRVEQWKQNPKGLATCYALRRLI